MNTGDTAWVLASSALVLLMTPGLAFFYAGMVRRKSAGSTLMQAFVTIGLVGIVWVLWGYSLAFSTAESDTLNKVIGGFNFIGLNNVPAAVDNVFSDTIPHQAFMIFQAMFAIITPALILGAFAERIKFSAYLVFVVLWVTIVYAPVAHWVWGGGWLGDLGALDYAGGTVVHINAGVAALAAAWLVFGKRVGHGTESMLPHNVPFVVLGAGLLWFGWFGFNAGSALAADESAVSAFVVTNTAAAAAMLAWLAVEWLHRGKPTVVGGASGAVAGLVAITPAAGFVGPMPSILIGLAAGVACYWAVAGVAKLRVDDSLAVFGVHGVGGMVGAILTGLLVGVGVTIPGFANEVSVMEQIVNQLVAVGATIVWSFVLTSAILLGLKHTIGVRVSEEDEETGLDITQHGEEAYA